MGIILTLPQSIILMSWIAVCERHIYVWIITIITDLQGVEEYREYVYKNKECHENFHKHYYYSGIIDFKTKQNACFLLSFSNTMHIHLSTLYLWIWIWCIFFIMPVSGFPCLCLPLPVYYANSQPWNQDATFQSSDSWAGELLATIPFPHPLPGHLVFHLL